MKKPKSYVLTIPAALAEQLRAITFRKTDLDDLKNGFCSTGRGIVADFYAWAKKRGRKSPYTALDAVQWSVETDAKHHYVRNYVTVPTDVLRRIADIAHVPETVYLAVMTLWNDLAETYEAPNNSAKIDRLDAKANKLQDKIEALQRQISDIEDEIDELNAEEGYGLSIDDVSFAVEKPKAAKATKRTSKSTRKAAA